MTMTIREQLEEREKQYLSPYAVLSRNSRGRMREEVQCDIRPVFQRDRDRILHCKAFQNIRFIIRLNSKQQIKNTLSLLYAMEAALPYPNIFLSRNILHHGDLS